MGESIRSSIALRVVAAGATDIGNGRKHNEDTVLLRTDLQLYVLADGAGGHNAGNVASALATTSIANYLEEHPSDGSHGPIDRFGLARGARLLATAIQRANRDIIEIANTSNRRKGMGTTVVALQVDCEESVLHLAHVGDSRCYRQRDAHFELLTFDHSLLHDVLEMRPDMDNDALSRLPRHVVTRALGMEEPVRVSVRTHQMVLGDRYLLCSDGLTDALEPEEISEVLRTPRTPEEQVGLLIDLAKNAGGQDNIAAVVIVCELGGALGASRRWAAVPRPRRAAQVAPSDESQAEILIVSGEPAPELEWDASIHVVPAEGVNPELIDALEDYLGAASSAGRKPVA